MAEYYVGCGLFGTIYAGKITPPRKDGFQNAVYMSFNRTKIKTS